MPSVLSLAYDTSTGRFLAMLTGADQIGVNAIVSGKIGSGGIGVLNLFKDGLFTADTEGWGKFAAGFAGSGLIGALAVGTPHLANQGIISAKIGANVVATPHIAAGGILSGAIGANALATPHIANQGILSASFGAGVIGNPHILTGSLLSGPLASGILGAFHLRDQAILSAAIGAGILATPHIANQGILSASIGATAIGAPHLATGAIVSGKMADNSINLTAIPDALITEAKLISGISIDIAESLSEPTTIAAEPISSHASIAFLSGYAGKRVGLALANDPNRMPAFGKIGATAIASGASMTTNPVLSYGRQTSPILSGNAGRLAYVGTNAQPTVTAPSASGNCVQVLGQVADNDGALFLFPMSQFIQIGA